MGVSLGGASKKLPEPEINVTPLVDVVLVLLIIFMVITPALNEGEHVELPKLTQPDPKPKDMNPIDVTLTQHGRTLLDKNAIEPTELEVKLREMHQAEPERNLILKTDERVEYRRVRTTFAMLQRIGFKGLSLKVLEKKSAKNGA